MISKASVLLTKQLTKKGFIMQEEQDLYEYAFFMIVSYLLFFFISILVGLIVGIPLESVLFFCAFSVIRNHAGGIHASTEAKCTVITTILIISCLITLKLMIRYSLCELSIALMLVAIFCFSFIKPVDNSNKKLSKAERNNQHKKVIILSTAYLIVFFVAFLIKKQSIAFSLSVSMILAAVLLVAGKLKNSKKNCEKKSAI